jgi:poly-gamma-glutamate synthesis protein (capsule biosynthesis protein)
MVQRGSGKRTVRRCTAATRLDRRAFLRLSGVATLALVSARTQAGAAVKQLDRTRGERSGASDLITIFLCGDVMTGRGIDQVLPHPSDPRLCEPYVTSATEYVRLAEAAHGPIPKPVGFSYVWGAALGELERVRPDVRIINLETSVTRSDECVSKGVNYRMSPENFPCISAARIDCCVLANNHIVDWGRSGLLETLETLEKRSVKGAGAGRNIEQASAPAVLELAGGKRVLVFSLGSVTSGIPRDWAAAHDTPGVNLLEELSRRTARRIAERVREVKRPGDVVVASIHWGANWGYEVPPEQTAFAHELIDAAGVDVVHGHSSHHAKGIEVYRGRPILYGCGDFVNDYEGIEGYEEFRDDLVVMYFLDVDAPSGELAGLELVPLRIRRFRLTRVPRTDAEWLRDTLNREGERFGTRVELLEGNALRLLWD